MAAAGSIYAAAQGARAARNIRNNVLGQQQNARDWYDRRYNEDATQRGDAQRILTMTMDAIRNRNRQANGAAAVGGATDESVALQKAANAQALANATGQINAMNEQRKDAIEQTFQTRDAMLNAQLNNAEDKRAQNVAQAMKGVSDAAGSLANVGIDKTSDIKNIFG